MQDSQNITVKPGDTFITPFHHGHRVVREVVGSTIFDEDGAWTTDPTGLIIIDRPLRDANGREYAVGDAIMQVGVKRQYTIVGLNEDREGGRAIGSIRFRGFAGGNYSSYNPQEWEIVLDPAPIRDVAGTEIQVGDTVEHVEGMYKGSTVTALNATTSNPSPGAFAFKTARGQALWSSNPWAYRVVKKAEPTPAEDPGPTNSYIEDAKAKQQAASDALTKAQAARSEAQAEIERQTALIYEYQGIIDALS